MKTKNNFYTADKPIYDKDDDAFQRYDFSKRIAETIISRKSKDSIVFGIFGAWGEGKTSVLNFIKTEISKSSDDFIQITFNPWRFTDEAALLTSFFNALAREIKKSVPENKDSKIADKKDNWFRRQRKSFEEQKEPLKTNTEAIGDLIQDYGKLAAIFGAGDVAETVGKILSDVDIETLKERIEKLLEKHQKRIVIFLDDIDRLDKSEIHTIFRLVKLTGDFSYTNYILSFDEDMVSSAIGERFGSGDKKAGENFLEKIIQVPLIIPKAQSDALKTYCFRLIDEANINNQVQLSQDEAERFVYQFTTNILSRLNTPRLAVRYGNTLSFSIPLLYGEVNIVDLMLIEAVKIFFPNHYRFIKNNPDYFIGSYNNYFSPGSDTKKIEAIKGHFNDLQEGLSEKEGKMIKDLLTNLFPLLDSAFTNYHFSNSTYKEWYLKKRITSTKYFYRYFSYAVIEGDISDVEFKILFERIKASDDIDKITESIRDSIDKTTKDNFIQKLRSQEEEYDWETAMKLSKSLSKISNLLPKEGSAMSMGHETPFSQSAIFIYQLLKNHKEDQNIYDFAKEMMNFPPQFEFASELNRWFRSGEKKEDKLFDDYQYQELAKILTERAITEADEEPIFTVFPEQSGFLALAWAERDKLEFDSYIEKILQEKPENIIPVIKVFVPTIRSSAKRNPYKGDLTKDRYDLFVSVIDKERIMKAIVSAISIEELEKEDHYWDDFGSKEYSELNMARQFMHWYDEEKKNHHNK